VTPVTVASPPGREAGGWVGSLVDRALEAVSYQDVELAGMVVTDDDRIDGRYLEVHQGILSLLALQTPVATDLRIVGARSQVSQAKQAFADRNAQLAYD
jgi:phosphate transport system protein